MLQPRVADKDGTGHGVRKHDSEEFIIMYYPTETQLQMVCALLFRSLITAVLSGNPTVWFLGTHYHA